MRYYSLAILSLSLLLLLPSVAFCESELRLPTTHNGRSLFDGLVVTGGVGWDFMRVEEGSRNLQDPVPGVFATVKSNGNGFFGEGSLGYGRVICSIYLGGRIGYRGCVKETALLRRVTGQPLRRYSLRYGAFGDFIFGTTCLPGWLGYGILGAQPDNYKFFGGENVIPFRNQKMWVWSPRLGLGIQRALDCHVSLGAEYRFSFSNKIWHQTKFALGGPPGGDLDQRRLKTQNHQIALTFNFRT